MNKLAIASVALVALFSSQGAPPALAEAFQIPFQPSVPHDVSNGSSATITDLAYFAWEEFIALNWTALDPATTGQRGRPDPTADFLSIKPDGDGNYPLLVWQTYRHKNELFPADGKTDPSFDSKAPTYNYKGSHTYSEVHNFNNLDESSQIGLCNMFAHDNTNRIVYEAKVNRAIFDYANNNKLTYCDNKDHCPPPTAPPGTGLTAARDKTSRDLAQYGGICSTDQSIVSLPCGDPAATGDAGEGAIEIKAAWRQLTTDEMNSRPRRFYTRKVVYYSGEFDAQKYNEAVFGLVALHIIHKTKSFPDFVFATWEQVDNYDDKDNKNTEHLNFVNTGTHLPPIPVNLFKREHAIHSMIGPVNDAVHQVFTAKDPSTVWQYYKLVGVQATPLNGPPPSTASADELSYYYLANIVVESNQTLQTFFGGAPYGLVVPSLNVYLKGATGSPFQMGGCQGCHGFQGQSIGGDMSRLIARAPFNSTHQPESIDASVAASLKSYRERSAGE